MTAPAGQFPGTDRPARVTAWLARTSSWPLSSAGVQLPYGWYLVTLLILVALPVHHRATAAAGGQ